MRIVAGRHKGRPIAAPHGRDTRPTADRTRQALFNVLAHAYGIVLDETAVVDVFAGSGALGLEALSQGARRACFLEQHAVAIETIRANLRSLGETERGEVVRGDATKPPPARQPCGLAFLDPPYGSALAGPALTALAGKGWLADEALCVVEIAAREEFTPPPGFALEEERLYGAARLVFVRKEAG